MVRTSSLDSPAFSALSGFVYRRALAFTAWMNRSMEPGLELASSRPGCEASRFSAIASFLSLQAETS